MSDLPEYHEGKNFRGYMEVPQATFDQITPFMQRDQIKMQELLRDQPTTPDKPKWTEETPTETVEWSGYIIVRGQK